MKKIISILIFFSLNYFCFSQGVIPGLKLGVNYATLHGSTIGKTKAIPSLEAGFNFVTEITDKWELFAEWTYSHKKIELTGRTRDYSSISTTEVQSIKSLQQFTNWSYLATYHIKYPYFSIQAGINFGLTGFSKQNAYSSDNPALYIGPYTDDNVDNYIYSDDIASKIMYKEYAATFGFITGIEPIRLSVRYMYGLNNFNHSYQSTEKITANTFQVSLIYIFNDVMLVGN